MVVERTHGGTRHRLRTRLGAGVMGEVHRAEDAALGGEAARKRLARARRFRVTFATDCTGVTGPSVSRGSPRKRITATTSARSFRRWGAVMPDASLSSSSRGSGRSATRAPRSAAVAGPENATGFGWRSPGQVDLARD